MSCWPWYPPKRSRYRVIRPSCCSAGSRAVGAIRRRAAPRILVAKCPSRRASSACVVWRLLVPRVDKVEAGAPGSARGSAFRRGTSRAAAGFARGGGPSRELGAFAGNLAEGPFQRRARSHLLPPFPSPRPAWQEERAGQRWPRGPLQKPQAVPLWSSSAGLAVLHLAGASDTAV